MVQQNLVIVESPAKAKTIAKYLNENKNLKTYGKFIVVSSMGHIRDLKKNELGIDIANEFTPHYQVTSEKIGTVNELKKRAAECDVVWIASDYDREGEGIAMHIKHVLNLQSYKRITFTEITPQALENAVKNPRLIDNHLVASQETRRILDRLVGFKLSPVLWKKYKTENMTGLSAGRVQSAVMHIIMEREHAIKNFDTGSYYYFYGEFNLKLQKMTSPYDLKDVKLYKNGTVYKEEQRPVVLQLLKSLKNEYLITEVKAKETKKNADLPFITSSLQQEAHSKFGYPLKRTMQLAQELYEKGYITYMRTDSYNISDNFKTAVKEYILREYSEEYYGGCSSKKRVQKNAQEAHEAIRPTDIEVRQSDIIISPDHKKLYDMIWKRTVAYFMKPCINAELHIKITDASFAEDLYFLSVFSKVKFNGFMIVYGVENDKYDFWMYIDNIKANKYKLTCDSIVAKNTWSNPPQRYNESSIIKVLESAGIGRPSTYASIMTKLFEKKYIIKSDVTGIEKETTSYIYTKKTIKEEKGKVIIGNERTRLLPTQIGEEIDSFLSSSFAYIVDKEFTSNMEADLDKIAEGEKNKKDVLSGFWGVFNTDLEKFNSIKHEKVMLKNDKYTHTIDGQDFIVRNAKYGPVIEYFDKNKDIVGKPKPIFITLKPYLKYFRKETSDIDETDIRLLLSFPRDLLQIDGKPFAFVYGPYGFYGKYDGRNIRLQLRTIMGVLRDTLTDSELKQQVRGSIEYKNAKQETADVPRNEDKKVHKKKYTKKE